ncbi:uracil-DNA glycosylase family protein [Cupriavidus sp. RAF12]
MPHKLRWQTMQLPHGAEGVVNALQREITACTRCAPQLAAGPRPIVQFSATSRILIIGQAPGSRVHASGIPFDDPSGDRLRDWTGLTPDEFYDPARVALMPMGFCYPGKGKSGDLPPRPECAPLWHQRVLDLLPADRLTLLVGTYAQARYLPKEARDSMTAAVQNFRDFGSAVFPLPHPSWRVVGWMRKHPWFEAELLPALRAAIRSRLT